MATKIQQRNLREGEIVEVKGSAAKPYIIKNIAGVISCSCPSWRMQSLPIDKRTCKHIKQVLGNDRDVQRLAPQTATVTGMMPRRAICISDDYKPSAKTPPIKPTPPPLTLAMPYDGVQNIVGWLMTEKLDGVRAYWDGNKLLSRLGNQFFAPDWFTKDFPSIPLDGELWIGRKQFQNTVSIVRRQNADNEWAKIKYVIFDSPGVDGTYEQRMAHISTVVFNKRQPPDPIKYIGGSSVYGIVCGGKWALNDELYRIEQLGGEGIMLRDPNSFYDIGRSNTLLKVKSFKDDEAQVIGYTKGRGKYKGLIGALRVIYNDVEFSIGSGLSEKEHKNPPKIGSLVTFKYQELSSNGVPRFPTYIGVREQL